MRFVLVAASVALLAACASQPPAKPATVAQASPPASSQTSTAHPSTPANAAQGDKFATIDATNLVEAQKAGYKVVNDKGAPLLCRRDHPTGTRLKEVTTCLTLEEWRSANRNARDAMDKPMYNNPSER
jgi:hypothetical protein